jgi:hypothetical protein
MRKKAVAAATLTSLRQPGPNDRPRRELSTTPTVLAENRAPQPQRPPPNVAASALTAAKPKTTGTVKADATHAGNWRPSEVTLKYT